MRCKFCGVSIHKCASANEYHADDNTEYIKELNGSGCIHEPELSPTSAAPSPLLSYETEGRLKARELQDVYDMRLVDQGQSDTVIVRHLKDCDGNLWTEIESRLEPPEYYYKFYCTKAVRAFTCITKGEKS